MILLWVMSILMYLTWAITQLEQYLVLELKTIAVYQGHLEDFQKTEHVLLACEKSLPRTCFTRELPIKNNLLSITC